MNTHDFYYDLPPELIAQHPAGRRDHSRLMLLDRTTGRIGHAHFYDLPKYLRPEDCLILNDTRVLPARIYGTRRDTGAVVEFLLLSRLENGDWEALAGPGKKAKPGHVFDFGNVMACEVAAVRDDGNRILHFLHDGVFLEKLEQVGKMPLPHYITEELKDNERYQTVYAKTPGSAAAPTAGLHFTPQLLKQIEATGVGIGYVTLHVGLGTFRPVKVDDVENHHMHSEFYMIDQAAAEKINRAKETGGRVICVGTTSCRTIESAADENGLLKACSGWTDIFIYPGYQFKILDALITNFHLPESTLVMLVSALAGREHVLAAYEEAVKERYRFFSFGDAMFIV